MFDIEEELKKLPACPGVYIMHDDQDAIIYVGKAISLKNRVRQYFQKSRNHAFRMPAEFCGHIGHNQNGEAFAVFLDLFHQIQKSGPVAALGGENIVGEAVHSGFGGHSDLIVAVEFRPVGDAAGKAGDRTLVDEMAIGAVFSVFSVRMEIAFLIVIICRIAVVDGDRKLREVVCKDFLFHAAEGFFRQAVEGPLFSRLLFFRRKRGCAQKERRRNGSGKECVPLFHDRIS